jgi:hypothetical protein
MSYLVKIKTGVGGYGADGVKRYFGKGGGDSGAREATAEEKRLWAAQGAALEGMTKLSLPMLETGMNNLGVMANETMDGTLSSRLRGMAGADASAAMGQGLTGATQKLERYGSTMNPNALGAQMNNSALQGAAMKSSAMNQANMGAEDLKWSRNAALTGLASGQGNSAVSGMGSLAGQIGQNRQMNMQADNQAMQGLGMAGAWAGSKMFADGGEVRLAGGGMPGLQSYRPQSISFQPWEISGSSGYKGPSTLDKIGAVATPIAMQAAASAAKPIVKDAVKGVLGLNNAPTKAPVVEGNVKSVVDGKIFEDVGEIPGDVGGDVLDASIDTADTMLEAGGDAVADAGADALGDAIPYAGVVKDFAEGDIPQAGLKLALMSNPATAPFAFLTSFLKDGGSVAQGLKRKDMTKGGEVDGPGTSVSDSIPARLSDGEFVLNEGAVKMLGVDKLEALNQEGLKYRSEEPHLAGGGFLSGLGMAAHGFVPTMMQLDKQKQDEAFRKEQLGLQKAADARAIAADAREAKKFADEQALIDAERAVRESHAGDPLEWGRKKFNGDEGILGQGNYKGKDVEFVPMSNGMIRATMYDRGTKNAAGYQDFSEADLRAQAERLRGNTMLSELARANPGKYLHMAEQRAHQDEQMKMLMANQEEMGRRWQATHDAGRDDQAQSNKFTERKLNLLERQVANEGARANQGRFQMMTVYDKVTGEPRMIKVDTQGMPANGEFRAPEGTTMNKPGGASAALEYAQSQLKTVDSRIEQLQKMGRPSWSILSNEQEKYDKEMEELNRTRSEYTRQIGAVGQLPARDGGKKSEAAKEESKPKLSDAKVADEKWKSRGKKLETVHGSSEPVWVEEFINIATGEIQKRPVGKGLSSMATFK